MPFNDPTAFSLIQEDVTTPFSPHRFSRPRVPYRVGTINSGTFGSLPSCLDMLIKCPDEDIIIPDPYAQDNGLLSFLNIAFKAEDKLLPDWRTTHYAYLTFDQRPIVSGKTHRNSGWHFDGMQGSRYPQKLNACHQYVCSSRLPTEFTNAPTDATGLDELRHNWFTSLGEQAEGIGKIYQAHPGDIVLMSAYQLHRSPVATFEDEGLRTFVRLDISLKQQDRLGNTVNPSLNAPWTFVERNLPDGLHHKVVDSGWAHSEKF
jgi:hypothetical protein